MEGYSTITVDKAVKIDNAIFVDVRSPVEYIAGSIPGAVNIPLFSDVERAVVGTVYKTIGPDKAKQQGLEFVSSKLPDMVAQFRALESQCQNLIVYCWRGGMRSQALVSVLGLMGIKAFQLVGGYKAYRRYVLESLLNFPLTAEIVVICGSTGAGKTKLLDILGKRGLPVINLERIANHRGSIFGHIGLGSPTTAKNFDALLLSRLCQLKDSPYIIVECESRRVGNAFLPDVIYNAMQCGKKALLKTSLEIRIDRLIEDYSALNKETELDIRESIKSLTRKLGHRKIDMLLNLYSAGAIREVTKILLTDYYDPLYGYEHSSPGDYDIILDGDDLEGAAEGG